MKKHFLWQAFMVMLFIALLLSGRRSEAQVTLFTEDFENASVGSIPPAPWDIDLVSGPDYCVFLDSGTNPTCIPPSGSRMVEFLSYNAPEGTENRLKMTTPVSTLGYTGITVDFQWLTDPEFAGVLDRVTVQYSTDGSTWTSVGTFNRYGTVQEWTTQTVSLPVAAGGQATLYIAFDFISAFGNNCNLDLVHICGNGPPLRRLFTEDFEGAPVGQTPPAGWSVDLMGFSNYTWFVSSGTYPACSPFEGTRMMEFNSYNAFAGTENQLKMTTAISTVGYTGITVGFRWFTDPNYTYYRDYVNVQYSLNGFIWWTVATVSRYSPITAWTEQSVLLPLEASGQTTLYIAFDFVSAFGNNCHLDYITVSGVGPMTPRTATVGDGTVSCNYPYTTNWMGGRTQLLYTAEQLEAGGLTPGVITAIGFDVYSYSNQNMVNFNLNMLNTDATTLTDWTTGMQNCYTGSYAVPGTGWQMINLQTPFVWDGRNLILEICFGSNETNTDCSYLNGTTAPTEQIRPYWLNNRPGCSYSGASHTGYTGLPNLRLVETPYSGVLSGQVTSCYNQAPLSFVGVFCGDVYTYTNSSGNYILYDLPTGPRTAFYYSSNYVTGIAPCAISNNDTTSLDICLDPINGFMNCPPTNLAVTDAGNTAGLNWSKPDCNGAGLHCYEYDDATMENGWLINPGYDEWLGNWIPAPVTDHGLLTSFRMLWWGNSLAVNDEHLQIDILSKDGTLLGSSQFFPVPIPAPLGYMVLNLIRPIPFTGPFYAMIHWNFVSNDTHFLGIDYDGPNVEDDLAFYYDGFTFIPISYWAGMPGVFCLTACGTLSPDGPEVVIGPEPPVRAKQMKSASPAGLSCAVTGTAQKTPQVPAVVPPATHGPTGITSAPALTGYNLYESADSTGPWSFVQFCAGQNNLAAAISGLGIGVHWFLVTAVYDLTTWGFPGVTEESMPDGPDAAYILVIPINRTILDEIVLEGQDFCYDATNTLTIAGNGTWYTVENAGSATMVAGMRIRYLDGTTVEPGGYMHGYITSSGIYCSGKSAGTTAMGTEVQALPASASQDLFRVFPNPTGGAFTLEMPAGDASQDVSVRIFGMMGEIVFSATVKGSPAYGFSLAGSPPGVYFIRVISGDRSATVKIIRQ